MAFYMQHLVGQDYFYLLRVYNTDALDISVSFFVYKWVCTHCVYCMYACMYM